MTETPGIPSIELCSRRGALIPTEVHQLRKFPLFLQALFTRDVSCFGKNHPSTNPRRMEDSRTRNTRRCTFDVEENILMLSLGHACVVSALSFQTTTFAFAS
mmetsp:Transcript_20778/g.30759  ORF Transcript_20778/g.30759 Transcript_20778/m.30759 type:complete len:102 (-) Transcript_20778:10-315(-)